MDIRPRIICGFPGVGKTTLFKKLQEQGFPILDSDSSTFDKSQFPQNYIEHIKKALDDGKWVLVSTHAEVRKALAAEGLAYVLARPIDVWCKDEYMKRYRERGSPEGFLKLMEAKWEEFFKDVEGDPVGITYPLSEWEHLERIMPDLVLAHKRDQVCTFTIDALDASIDIGVPFHSLDFMDGFTLGKMFAELGAMKAACYTTSMREYTVHKRLLPMCHEIAVRLRLNIESKVALGDHARRVKFFSGNKQA